MVVRMLPPYIICYQIIKHHCLQNINHNKNYQNIIIKLQKKKYHWIYLSPRFLLYLLYCKACLISAIIVCTVVIGIT